jgi:hypothetical protein
MFRKVRLVCDLRFQDNMRLQRKKHQAERKWLLAAGLVVTGAVTFYALSRIFRSEGRRQRREHRALQNRVVQRLMDDPSAGSHSIDVAVVGAGVVELSGLIDTQADAQHIIHLVDAVPGVHAVINRLDVSEIESKLQRNRAKPRSEAARWYGNNVGMGRRRHNPATDPARPDDHAAILEHALQPNLEDTLRDVEEDGNHAHIGMSHSTGFATRVAPHSPDPEAGFARQTA